LRQAFFEFFEGEMDYGSKGEEEDGNAPCRESEEGERENTDSPDANSDGEYFGWPGGNERERNVELLAEIFHEEEKERGDDDELPDDEATGNETGENGFQSEESCKREEDEEDRLDKEGIENVSIALFDQFFEKFC
jgi:hypothetical protein